MRAWVIAAALCACGNKEPKLTDAWKTAFHNIAPDCGGDELGENGSWSCKDDKLRMLIRVQDNHLQHVAFWIGADDSQTALRRIEQVSALVRPAVWAGIRAHIDQPTEIESESLSDEDGRPVIRYNSGITKQSELYDPKTMSQIQTYFVRIAWDDGY